MAELEGPALAARRVEFAERFTDAKKVDTGIRHVGTLSGKRRGLPRSSDVTEETVFVRYSAAVRFGVSAIISSASRTISLRSPP